MSQAVVPEDGVDWVADRCIGTEEDLGYIALGSGTEDVSKDDDGLSELDAPQVSIESRNASVSRSATTGMLACSVTVVGGEEVDPGMEITELGLFTESDRLVYREVRDSVLIEENQRVTIQFDVTFESVLEEN